MARRSGTSRLAASVSKPRTLPNPSVRGSTKPQSFVNPKQARGQTPVRDVTREKSMAANDVLAHDSPSWVECKQTYSHSRQSPFLKVSSSAPIVASGSPEHSVRRLEIKIKSCIFNRFAECICDLKRPAQFGFRHALEKGVRFCP